MRNRFFILGLLLALLVTFSALTELAFSNENGREFAKSSSGSGVIKAPQKQEKKKTVYVYITKTGKKYHKGDCRYLKKSKVKITLEEACKRGYTPCKVCKPPKCPKK